MPACVLPNPSCCLPQAWSCSIQACGREPSGNVCLLLGISDSSIYLDSPRSQSQRFTSHLDASPSQAELESRLEQTAFFRSGHRNPPCWFQLSSPFLTGAPLLQHCPICLSVRVCVYTYLYICLFFFFYLVWT